MPLARAALEPQPVHRRWSTSHEPSANITIVEGRVTGGKAGWPGALMIAATLPQK